MTDTVKPVVKTVTETAAPVEPISRPVVETIAPVVDTVAPVLVPVTEVIEPVVGPVVDIIEPVLPPIVEIIEPIIDIVDPVIDPVIDIVDPVIDPIIDIVPPVLPSGELPASSAPNAVLSSDQLLRPDLSGTIASLEANAGQALFGLDPLSGGSALTIDSTAAQPNAAAPAATALTLAGPSLTDGSPSTDATPGAPSKSTGKQQSQPAAGSLQRGAERFDWPSSGLLALYVALLAAGCFVLLTVTEASPRSLQFRLVTPPN